MWKRELRNTEVDANATMHFFTAHNSLMTPTLLSLSLQPGPSSFLVSCVRRDHPSPFLLWPEETTGMMNLRLSMCISHQYQFSHLDPTSLRVIVADCWIKHHHGNCRIWLWFSLSLSALSPTSYCFGGRGFQVIILCVLLVCIARLRLKRWSFVYAMAINRCKGVQNDGIC